MKPWELIDGLEELVLPENPRAFAMKVLDKCIEHLGARRVALFSRELDWMHLFASRAVDQAVIDAVSQIWEVHRKELESDQLVVLPSVRNPAEPALRPALAGAEALAVLPVAGRDRLVGLLYMDSRKPFGREQLAAARQLARIAAVALRLPPARLLAGGADGPVGAYLARVSPDEILRDQLLRLLEDEEWNIARVARLLRVSRVTIYNRLRRFGIERKKVLKGPVRSLA
jgi:transcriptional regulator with GAF, ATPase, and Fis domain